MTNNRGPSLSKSDTRRRSVGLAGHHRLLAASDRLSKESRFNSEECKVLLYIYDKITMECPLDRLRMREILLSAFQITDDVMLDLVYKSFDRDNDGIISESEWIQGLSVMIRGTLDQLSEHCYTIYDMNGDGSLAREELTHCLKGCIVPGYGVDQDDVDECERDIIEICMKKLDIDKDGQITLSDFQNAVQMDPLLLQAIGPCLPGVKSIAAFMSLVTDRFRNYTEIYTRRYIERKMTKVKPSMNINIFKSMGAVTLKPGMIRESLMSIHSSAAGGGVQGGGGGGGGGSVVKADSSGGVVG